MAGGIPVDGDGDADADAGLGGQLGERSDPLLSVFSLEIENGDLRDFLGFFLFSVTMIYFDPDNGIYSTTTCAATVLTQVHPISGGDDGDDGG